MNTTIKRLKEIKSNGYTLDFAAVLEHTFKNYKKIALYAGLMLLVSIILLFVVVMTGIVAYVGVENFEAFGEKLKEYSTLKELPLEVTLSLNMGLIIFSSLLNPFMAGFLKMADCGENGEEFNVSTMFSYYKLPYFFHLFISFMFITVVSTAIGLLCDYAGLIGLNLLFSFLISFLTIFTGTLIIFGKLNAFDAIFSSISIVSKQALQLFRFVTIPVFSVVLGLLFITEIGGIFGLIGFLILLFFTMPYIYSMNYIVYKTIVGIEDASESEKTKKESY